MQHIWCQNGKTTGEFIKCLSCGISSAANPNCLYHSLESDKQYMTNMVFITEEMP
jgi:hypothetical protein